MRMGVESVIFWSPFGWGLKRLELPLMGSVGAWQMQTLKGLKTLNVHNCRESYARWLFLSPYSFTQMALSDLPSRDQMTMEYMPGRRSRTSIPCSGSAIR